MSRFKFGDIVATIERLGSVQTDPGHDQYTVRLDHPDGASWIETRMEVPKAPRTVATDYRLAFNMIGKLKGAVDEPQRWMREVSKGGEISREEILATLEMAQKFDPYFEDAIDAAMDRAYLYSEYFEPRKRLGIARPLHLPNKIRTKEELANFFAYLYREENLSFHPDEDFNTYVDSGTGAPSYTMEEAHDRNRLMAEAFETADREKLDIYEVGLWVGALLQVVGSDEDVSDVPEWLRKLAETWI